MATPPNTLRLQLMLRAEKLPLVGKHWRMKSPNSFCVVSHISEIGSVLGIQRTRVGVTEVVHSSRHPEWAPVLVLEHMRGTEHKIAIDVFHTEKNYNNHHHHHHHSKNEQPAQLVPWDDHRGKPVVDENSEQVCGILVDVETVLSHRDQCITEPIPGSLGGKLVISMEVSGSDGYTIAHFNNSSTFRFQLRGFQLPNPRLAFIDRPNFCYEIRRKQPGLTQDSWALVYRSPCAPASLNPYWDPILLDLEGLCNFNEDRELEITVMDQTDTSTRHVVGWCRTTLQGLIQAKSTKGNCDRDKALVLVRDKKSRAMLGKLVVLHASVVGTEDEEICESSGHRRHSSSSCHHQQEGIPIAQVVAVPVEVTAPSILQPRATFEDYMAMSQARLELCLAIDFTQSNGNFSVAGTPHHISLTDHNDYEWTMGVMGQAVGRFNTVRQFPVWGFGAVFNQVPRPIFQVGPAARAEGARGLLEAYRAAFDTGIELGPEINYDRVIQAAAHYSQKQLDEAQRAGSISYTLLFILTTGSERDILQARTTLEAVHTAPMSVVFLRIDNGTTPSPPQLNDCKLGTRLSQTGIRPFCTFLEAKEFTKNRNAEALVETSLANVKPQLVQYFGSRGIYPR